MLRRLPDLPEFAPLRGPLVAFALCGPVALAALGAAPAPLAAQAVVQASPDPAAEDLRTALRGLAANPESLADLLAAGHASLSLGDADAALGFFARAQDVAPDNGEVMVGLALVALRQEDVVDALGWFDLAEASGGDLSPFLGDRGLAFDLAGAGERARAFYRQALAREAEDEVVRRMAVSYAIAGDSAASEAMLLPLLQRQDMAAFRARAFSLAIMGRQYEAASIVETMLPGRVSSRMMPYLRAMPRLTPAQQAAAANLGTFPEEDQIGRDDPELAAYLSGGTAVARRSGPPARPGSRLAPQGEPLGPSARTAAQTTQPADLAEADIPAPPSFAEAFERLVQEDAEEQAPPDPVAEPEPQEQGRYWVQLGIGRNISAFAFDWRRRVRDAGGLLDGMEPYRVPARGTNRLVTGPFTSADEARELINNLRAAGVDAIPFTRDDDEEVVPLG